MPFMSRGRTLGFKKIGPFEITLRELLTELTSRNFKGRIIFDGRLDEEMLLMRIELKEERIVGLEVEINGNILSGIEAVKHLERVLDKGKGYAEIIELEDNEIELDLEENPRAKISLPLHNPVELTNLTTFHIAVKGDIALLNELLSNLNVEDCFLLEGMMGGKECQGVMKGEICHNKMSVMLSIGSNTILISNLDELRGAINSISNKCELLELYAKKASAE